MKRAALTLIALAAAAVALGQVPGTQSTPPAGPGPFDWGLAAPFDGGLPAPFDAGAPTLYGPDAGAPGSPITPQPRGRNAPRPPRVTPDQLGSMCSVATDEADANRNPDVAGRLPAS